MDSLDSKFNSLKGSLEGEFKFDIITKTIYSTDASDYKEEPVAVAWPKGILDLKKLIFFALEEKIGLTIRAAGTSLAGQVVTSGIIADISRHMNRILEVNREEKWVRVEPGVVLDELNMYLRPFGLFFGPETSTSSRCNMGGMVGNNSCGSHSLVYGSTRDHTLELKTLLSDGSEATFAPVDKNTFDKKCRQDNLEGKIYRELRDILDDPENKKSIRDGYPDPRINRRNTGYALDLLLDSEIFDTKSEKKFNFCRLLAGSEGTLAVTTEIKLNLVPLPPACKTLVCVHHRDRDEAFLANLVALKFKPSAVELTDDRILELTKDNLSQKNNRFFLDGDPGAIMMVEFARDTVEEVESVTDEMIKALKKAGYGYSYPVVRGKDMAKAWELRKAGLGVLGKMKGDRRTVSLVEDTAVRVEDLPAYMDDFAKLLAKYGKDSVYHAHIGTGELHIRPVLNLKDSGDVELFRTIGIETARLVKKYRGSLSGEHGDGRLRGEFIPLILGEANYQLLKKLKASWDPENILNPGKIVDTPLMNTFLRYEPGTLTPELETVYDFSSTEGIIRAAEKCNGSGDCRKSIKLGGTMCPSFMATMDEEKCTRARANILREFLSLKNSNPWDHKEIYDILDLCLGCKGCKSECPSGVDIAKMKSEFLQHWYDKHGIPLRTLLIAYISTFNRIGSFVPDIYNFFLKNKVFSGLLKRTIGFASERSIPIVYKTSLTRWIKKNLASMNPSKPIGKLCLFIDEFTNYNDTEAGIAAVRLLTALNYKVEVAEHDLSARTFISKGLLRKARKIAIKNINTFSGMIDENLPLVGIEPSAILGFRDEYPDLVNSDLREKSKKIAGNSFMVDEFIANEFKAGRIGRDKFTDEDLEILLHAHCQQKAVSSSACSVEMLSIPANYRVSEIPSGCCGMAGSFGYEKEHFELSKKIGELVLFPEILKSSDNVVVAAPGTSCRHHIKDGTGRIAKPPVVILYEALKKC
ncbi:MAG TPA: FAD-binding oxidoreductase [Bacteroidales bacterium]|jgi:FAD/FMN-containing dehydrogenase/Fe-S oxidoreductase|nr:FAD-binding oxidoreductase [Bacteroidales bacterium]HBZ20456.1 FAD-binding oxidoreductase [Bacteroidales bacterium]